MHGRTINANNYEAAAFEALKEGLRSGDLFVLGSHRYRSFESYLLAKDRWNALRAAGETRLALTMTAQEYIADRHTQITDLLTGLHRDLADLPWISVDAQGKLHLAALRADTPPEVKAVRQRVYRKLPRIPLAELLLDVDATTHVGSFQTSSTNLSLAPLMRAYLYRPLVSLVKVVHTVTDELAAQRTGTVHAQTGLVEISNSRSIERWHLCPDDSNMRSTSGMADTLGPVSERIEQLIETISREFNDNEHLSSNRTRFYKLWRHANVSEEAFLGLAFEARARTKARGNIEKPAKGSIYPGLRNKVPYFFQVLDSLIAAQPSTPPAGPLPPTAPDPRPSQLATFGLSLTVSVDGTIHASQPVALQPGCYNAVLVVAAPPKSQKPGPIIEHEVPS